MTWHNTMEIGWHTIKEIEWHSIQEITWHKMEEIRHNKLEPNPSQQKANLIRSSRRTLRVLFAYGG